MTYKTNKRQYPVPDDGQEPYDEDIQKAMAMLDTDITTLFSNRAKNSDLDNHVSDFNTLKSDFNTHTGKFDTLRSDFNSQVNEYDSHVTAYDSHVSDFNTHTANATAHHVPPSGSDIRGAVNGSAITPSSVDSDVVQSGELLLTEYSTAEDAPVGSGVGIIGVTSDGHLLMKDGQ